MQQMIEWSNEAYEHYVLGLRIKEEERREIDLLNVEDKICPPRPRFKEYRMIRTGWAIRGERCFSREQKRQFGKRRREKYARRETKAWLNDPQVDDFMFQQQRMYDELLFVHSFE